MSLRDDVLRVLGEHDDEAPLSVSQIKHRLPPDRGNTNIAKSVERLRDDDEYIDLVDGEGLRGDPYVYRINQSGREELSEDGEEPPSVPMNEDTDDTNDSEEVIRSVRLENRVASLEEEVEGLVEHIKKNDTARSTLREDLNQTADDVEDVYEDHQRVRKRLRILEETVESAEYLISISNDELVSLVDMVSRSDARNEVARRRMIRTLLGIAEDDEASTASRMTSEEETDEHDPNHE